MINKIMEKIQEWRGIDRTPTVLQMEAVECGAASLAMIMRYYDLIVPLEELRIACGVSRDGSKASNLLKAAREYGLEAKGYRKEPESLKEIDGPMIVHWNFNHFVVLEGFKNGTAYLNDPAMGRRTVSEEEFDQSFTGVVLTFEPTADFEPGGEKKNILSALKKRLEGAELGVAYIFLVGLALVVPGLVVPIFSKIFVDKVLLAQMDNWIKPLLIGMAITALLRGLLVWLREYFLIRLENSIALANSGKFFWHILSLPVEFFSQRYAGEVGNRVAINDRVAKMLSGRLASTFLDFLMIIFYAILMFRYDVVLTLVGITVAILNMLFLKLVSQKRVDQNKQLLQEQGKVQGVTMSGLKRIETLKASGREEDFFTKWAGHQAKLTNFQQELGVSGVYLSSVPKLLTALNSAVILVLGGFRVMDGVLTLGMLVAFQSLMSSFIGPVNKLVSLGGQLQQLKGDINKLDDALKYKRDQALNNELEVDENIENAKLEGDLKVQGLNFGYNKLEDPLIQDFNLELKPGYRVALVGGSGSGKSTIAKIIAGLYKPWNGTILFGGKSREDIPRELMANSLAMVDQDITMFEGTIKENLTLWDDTIPKIDIIRAAKDACIHQDISARSEGYNHAMEEGGSNFSGGQKQRLEIARALVSNPRILILDEATSALDPTTEKRIDENLRRRGCTCVIVAHRLSTIRDCDEIIVLDKGKIVQRGTHDELKNREGHYSNLIQLSG
ncbi:MAG: NHLP family bacteriocin export ABC transporter peptidase/permease/ATPase subunit [Bacillota bacterium]